MSNKRASTITNRRSSVRHVVENNVGAHHFISAWREFLSHPLLLSFKGWIRIRLKRAKPWFLRTIDKFSFQAVMFLMTVYALLGDDCRAAATPRSADTIFNSITIAALLLFSFELIASCIGKDDYFLGVFFFLDLVSTVSLVLDITWVARSFQNDANAARAGRMSRVGTRAGRVIRVIRLIRLIRIIKLYKHVVDGWRRFHGHNDAEPTRPGDGTDEEIYAESRVGQKLSRMTTQKVILLILVMLIILPNISVDQFFRDLPTSPQYGADVVYRAYVQCFNRTPGTTPGIPGRCRNVSCPAFEQQLAMYMGYHHRQAVTGCSDGWNQAFSASCKLDLAWVGFVADSCFQGYGTRPVEEYLAHLFDNASFPAGPLAKDMLLKLNTGTTTVCDDTRAGYISLVSDSSISCPGELRPEEQGIIVPRLVSLDDIADLIFVFDLRPWTLRSAVFNILQTVFICAILAVGAMVFSHDANVLVLQPIERMIAKVQKIRDNPLYAMKLGDETYREKQELEKEPQLERTAPPWRRRCCMRRRDLKVHTLETKILENAIIKLGKLLALGFGEAGTEIIGKNMHDETATVNAMIPGSKVEAVFGFCDIRNFTDTTEVLQDKVMVFVNQVAEIVHNIVDTWHGAANRNNGDAFLIVWRMREGFTAELRTKVADMSVVSFVYVVAAINKSAVLKDYREHPALLARLPNYRVRMGFGLHSGWAIEGAIGSEFKIDASYLSPHVNMACRLEAVTRQYQVSMLISEPLMQLCSPEMTRFFRTIDHVTLKGGMSTPIRLHTVDLRGESLKTDQVVPKKGENQFELRLQREKAKEEKMQSYFQVHSLFEDDPDLRMMRHGYPAVFFQLFSKGYVNYEAGEWDVAREVLMASRDMLGEVDGPSQALLEFMSRFDFDSSKVTLKGWLGYRELADA